MAASTGRIFLGVLFLICFHGLVSGYSRNDLDRYDVMIARLEARLLENQRRLEELIEANDDGERHAIKLDYRMDEFYPGRFNITAYCIFVNATQWNFEGSSQKHFSIIFLNRCSFVALRCAKYNYH